MKSSAVKALNFIIGIGLAALLIWLFFKDADWAAVGGAIARVDVALLLVAFAFQMLSIVVKSWRWRLLLTPVKPGIPVHSCFKYFNIGFATTSLLPGRVGEVLRPYLMAREQEIKFTSTFATIVTERVIDLVTVLLMFSTIFIFPSALGPNPDDPNVGLLKTAGLITLAVTAVAIGFLVLIKVRTGWAEAMVRFFGKPLPAKITDGVIKLVRAFADGVGGLRGAGQIGGLVLSSLIGWGGGIVFFWLAFQAFGLHAPWYHYIFLQAAAALGVTIPTPAGSGGYHGAIILVASRLWGMQTGVVQATALITHLLIFGSMTLIGVFYLVIGGINIFKTAERAEESVESSEAAQT